MTDIEPISRVLHEVAETHHVVWRITDGDDPDWASWYADWLLDLSELPALLGAKPVRSHLVHALVQLDRPVPSGQSPLTAEQLDVSPQRGDGDVHLLRELRESRRAGASETAQQQCVTAFDGSHDA